MSRIVKNPLTDDHVIFAPGRIKRPFQENITCPFCPGSEEIPEAFSEIRVLPNKFPSLSMKNQDPVDGSLAGKGICEVILYGSDHDTPLRLKSDEYIKELVTIWRDRSSSIELEYPEIEYIFIFENYGKEIGVSLEHPHGQLYAFPIVPRVIDHKLDKFSSEPECPLCLAQSYYEIIYSTETFWCGVPQYSKWPFEIHILPKRHFGKLQNITEQEISDLASCLKKSLNLMNDKFHKQVPYILSNYQAPVKGDIDPFHFYIELISPQITENKIKYRGGVETALGIFINTINPQELATELRGLINK